MKRSKILIAVVVALATGWLACKQSKGDRCQIDEDCSTGLVCNKATNTCQNTTGGGIDAKVPDAAIDAPDAM